MKFIILPNGNGIRADKVTSVRALDRCEASGGLKEPIKPRVVVQDDGHVCEICYVETFTEAIVVRDLILAKVEEAVKPQPPEVGWDDDWRTEK